MLKHLATFSGALLRSLFVSLVMLVIGYSVITGEFPPNFSKAKTSWQNLQEMSRLSQIALDRMRKETGQVGGTGGSEDDDIKLLEDLNRQRAQMGAGLLPAGKVPGIKDVSPTQENTHLRRIQELEVQLFRLQQRVSELEDNAQKSAQ